MAIGLAAIAGLAAQAADPTYHLVKEIQIGGAGGWDYIAVDSAAHRIYVSHATKVVVADTETGKVIGEIPDTPGVHGFAVAPELGLGFTSNGRDNSSTVVDLKTLKAVNEGHDRRQPGRHPLRAGAPRGLYVQRIGAVGDGVRGEDRHGRSRRSP